eukprot:jgi/Botrbrau1/18612/Bobra.0367s0052.2
MAWRRGAHISIQSTSSEVFQVVCCSFRANAPLGNNCRPNLWHVVLQLTSNSYDEYVLALNQEGYAVIQYDVILGVIPILVTDAIELQFPIQILEWLKFVSQNPASKFYNKFDFSRIAATGHSHGGKTAGLVYGLGLIPNVFTYIGIDPVDCPCFAPCSSSCYPSAAESIRGKVIATVGASIKGCCNPTEPPPSCTILGVPCLGIDYAGFLKRAAPASKNYVSYAGHIQYGDVCFGLGVCNFLEDLVCGANFSVTARQVQQVTAGQVVDWVNSRLPRRGGPKGPAAVAAPEPSLDPAIAAVGAGAPGGPQGPLGPTPEEIATDAALRTPINLQEGIDFTYADVVPPIVYQESLKRLIQADPALALQLQRASQTIPSATYGVAVDAADEASAAASPPSSQGQGHAVWPLSG